MSADPIRARLDAEDAFILYRYTYIDALRAVLEVNQEHRDILTGRGRYPGRINECRCLGCQSVRAIATALGVTQ